MNTPFDFGIGVDIEVGNVGSISLICSVSPCAGSIREATSIRRSAHVGGVGGVLLHNVAAGAWMGGVGAVNPAVETCAVRWWLGCCWLRRLWRLFLSIADVEARHEGVEDSVNGGC